MMAVDLEKLPADEEWLRLYGLDVAQNVLDALDLYRCRAKFYEQELERANASKAEAWAAVRVRDEEINVTVKRLRAELERANVRILGGGHGRIGRKP
jgi:hypothetical protein